SARPRQEDGQSPRSAADVRQGLPARPHEAGTLLEISPTNGRSLLACATDTTATTVFDHGLWAPPGGVLGSRAMALTFVAGTMTRSGRRRRPVPVRFLVDTGAVYTVLPENVWRGLGLRGDRVVEFTLADGTAIQRDVSECRIQVEGRSATSPVVLGGP